jgi:hypothetical protein
VIVQIQARSNRVKTAAERSIEALTWASVVIWLGFALVAHILNYVWLVVMMLGIILLSSAIYQRSRGWQTSLSLWIFGIWMAVFSVLETVSTLVAAVTGSEGLGIDLWVYLGIALVSMGVAVVFRTLQGPRVADRPRASAQRGNTGYARSGRYAAPGRVDEDLSTGYSPAPQDQYDNYGTSRGQRGQRPPQYNQPDDYGYEQPPRDDSQYTQPSQRGQYQPPRDDSQYTQSSRRGQYQQPVDDAQYTQSSQRGRRAAQPPPAPTPRERAPQPRPQRRARPAPEPNDLEARVDDIIRRSRERRGGSESGSGDDLPY